MNIIEVSWLWKSNLSNRSSTKYIALHHAEASKATVDQIDDWHKARGWSGIGYHFYVRKDGYIYRGRPINKIGSHVLGMNDCSVGICAEGSYMKEDMPNKQKKAICELIAYIKDNYYPNAEIVGHKEIGSSDCPGSNYPLWDIKTNYRFYASNNYSAEGDLTMTQYQELLNKINAQQSEISALRNELDVLRSEMIYNYVDSNMPDWARPIISALREVKVITGINDAGDLALKYSDLRNIVMSYRGGAYDEKLQVERDAEGNIISSPIVDRYKNI